MTMNPPMPCPTCGKPMHLVLVGKVNPVYVPRCDNVTVAHPVMICTPSITVSN